MDHDDLARLLNELGSRLSAGHIEADIFIVGGSAMALAYDSRRSTSDIDAIVRPSDVVMAEASAMAMDLGLEKNWLSEGVIDKMHGLADDPDPIDWTELAPDLTVRVRIGSPEYLLAMKAMSDRRSETDRDDAAVLCNILGITREREVEEIVRTFWGKNPLGSQELFVEDIIERAETMRTEGVRAGLDDLGRPSSPPRGGRCGWWMPLAKRTCSQPRGHGGQHR